MFPLRMKGRSQVGTSQDPLSMGQLGVLLQEPQWESVGRELHAPHSPRSKLHS